MPELFVSELFLSIQGESSFAGQPCGFIRLAGCPLRCRWCDTAYAFAGGTSRSVDDLLTEVAAWDVPLLEVTGGEPLDQAATGELLRALCDQGYAVLLETGGAHSIADVDPRVTIILDLKCPGSGEETGNRWDNLSALKPRDEVKFVIRDRTDFEWASRVVQRKSTLQRRTVLFSPVHDELDPGELAGWILEARLPVRLQVQLHKYLWPSIPRGV